MKAYYINLERAKERRQHMESQAARLGLDLVRIDAVDGLAMPSADAEKVCPVPGRTHKLSMVEIACFLSHREAWSLIATGDDTHAIILEDDLFLSPDFPYFANSANWIAEGYDVIKIETTARPMLLARPRLDAGLGRNLWRMASENRGSGGYVLSRKAARILLEETKTFADPVDYALFHPHSHVWKLLTFYQLVPALCVQQVRSKTVFLDAKAAASQMDGMRGTEKRKGAAKVLKELIRPFEKAITWIAMSLRAVMSGGRYGSIKVK